MSIFNHDVYDNVRTRVLVVHDGAVLLLRDDEMRAWGPPGGGLEPHESLSECAAREVREETGLSVTVGPVAFLREWVAPKYCTPPEPGDGHGFGLEVFFYATPAGPVTPLRPETPLHTMPEWVPLLRVPQLRVWPVELKSLAVAIARGTTPAGAPSFVSDLGDLDDPAPSVDWR